MKRTSRQDSSGATPGVPAPAANIAKSPAQTKEQRKQAGTWLKELRQRAGLSQIELADRLGFKYYTFISQIENDFGRVPTESLESWARSLGADPVKFTHKLLSHYEPELYRLLFVVKK